MSGHKPFSGPPSLIRHEKCVIEPLTFLETWPIMVAVATGISLGGGNLRYGALIELSILGGLVVSAVGSDASADSRRTSPADEMDRASNVRSGASATNVTGEGAGVSPHARPEGRGRA
jgi:hypothetical protein